METLFKVFEKFSSRPLFFFFGLSLCEFFQKQSVLMNPSADNIAKLFAAMILVVFLLGDLNG